MKVRVDFGFHGPKREVNWYSDIRSFPSIFRFDGKYWEAQMFLEDANANVDYIILFSELKHFDPTYYTVKVEDFDRFFNNPFGDKCECGAIYTSFPQIHMFFCPKWSKI